MPVELNDELDRLGVARLADFASAPVTSLIAPDTTAGLSATTDGQYFSVPSAESSEYLILYKNNAGAAVEVKRYPSASAVEKIQSGYIEMDQEVGEILGVAVAFRDAAGRAALYIDSDGKTHLQNDRLDHAVEVGEDLQPRVASLEDSVGALRVSGEPFERRLVWGVTDDSGKIGMALDHDAVLHTAGHGDFSDVSIRDGVVYVSGVSLGNSFYAIKARREGARVRMWSATQEYITIPGRSIIAVPKDGKVQLLLSSGQSLSTGYGTYLEPPRPSPSTNPYPQHILAVNGAVLTGPEANQLLASAVTDIIPAVNGPQYDSYGLAAMVQAARLYESSGGVPPTWVFASHGRGGATIAELMDTTTHWMYRNGVTQIQRAKALVEEYGLELSDRVILMYVQGESDTNNANYQSDLISLYNQYLATIKSELGADARLSMILDQLGRNYSIITSKAQYNAADLHPDIYLSNTKAILGWTHSVMKDYGLVGGAEDYTHLSKAGYWMQGCYFGLAMHGLMSRGNWEPILPRDIRVAGNKIHVRFSLVSGKLINDPSLWSVPHCGFSYSDSQGATISTVSVAGDTATITMSTDITSHTNRLLELGYVTESTGEFKGGTLRDENRIWIPELKEYLNNFAVSWSKAI